MKRFAAGDSFRTAINLGAFGDRTSIASGTIGDTNKAVYYRIRVLRSSFVALSLTGLTANADFQTFNQNRRLLATYDNLGTRREFAFQQVVPRGIYFLKVYPADRGENTSYRLNIFSVTNA